MAGIIKWLIILTISLWVLAAFEFPPAVAFWRELGVPTDLLLLERWFIDKLGRVTLWIDRNAGIVAAICMVVIFRTYIKFKRGPNDDY